MIKYDGKDLFNLDFNSLNELNVEAGLCYMPNEFEFENNELHKQIIELLEVLSGVKIASFETAEEAIGIITEKNMDSISSVVTKYINKLKIANKKLRGKTHYKIELKDMVNDNWDYKIIKDIII